VILNKSNINFFNSYTINELSKYIISFCFADIKLAGFTIENHSLRHITMNTTLKSLLGTFVFLIIFRSMETDRTTNWVTGKLLREQANQPAPELAQRSTASELQCPGGPGAAVVENRYRI
jgi:hypothetical protein